MVSNSGKGEFGSSSLSWGFDEKENESKEAKLKSPAKGSKNFMSMTILASSKIAQSRKKKILVERNNPVRTSITLSDGKAMFYSVNSEEHNKNSEKVMEPKETVPVDGLPPITKTPKTVTFLKASLNFESLSDTPAIASLDADPSLPPYDPKTNYLSWYTTLSSMAVSSNNKSPSSLSIRSFLPHPRTSENNNSTPRRSFNGNPFSRPSVLPTHRGFNPNAAKLKSPAKGSKNFLSLTISASSKIAQSQTKKILVERNDPVRTSITLFEGKDTFFSTISKEHNQNSEKVMDPKETIPVDGFPSVTKTPKMVMFSEASLNSESLYYTITMDSDICNDEPLVSPAIASLDVDPSLPPYDPKTNYLSPSKPKLDDCYLFELLFENLSDIDGNESSLIKDLLEESDGSSLEEAFTEATVDQEEEPAMPIDKQINEPALPVAEDISEAKIKSKSRSLTILRFLSLMLVLMIAFLSFSVTDSPILATPGSIIDLRFSNANSYFK
ncbi:hypothetical protein P3S68_016951 [Capsicum galapagoense]